MENTKPSMAINVIQEMCQIQIYVAEVAAALRFNSPYRGDCESRDPREVGLDVLWLSDSLHVLDRLGRAILSADADAIIASCDALLDHYRIFVDGTPGRHGKGNSKVTLAWYGHLFDPQTAIDLFTTIRAKALAVVTERGANSFLRDIEMYVQWELHKYLVFKRGLFL